MEPIIIDGHYRLEREIRNGGHGVIYYGQDIRLGRPVAVKRVVPHMDGPEGNAALLDEARVIARLQHPVITQVYDVRDAGDGGIYIIMEYVDGCDLRNIIRHSGALDAGTVAYIGQCICGALQYAHTAVNPVDGRPMEIVHRDITPANIMITRSGDVKLIDFGIARNTIRQQELTMTGTLKGTIAYMSPEQVRGDKDIDCRTDLFSLGAVLYEAAAGEKLFGGGGLSDFRQMQLVEKVDVDIDERCRAHGIADVLCSVLAGCLARDRKDRFGSADALRQALVPLTGTAADAGYRDALGRLVAETAAGECITAAVAAEPDDGKTVVLGQADAGTSSYERTITLNRPQAAPPGGFPDAVQSAKPKRNNKLLAVLSGVTVLVAGGGALFFTPGPAPVPSAPAPAPAEVPDVPAAPVMHTVTIRSVPAGAGVFTADGTVSLGEGFAALPVRDTALLLRLDGYRDLVCQISGDAVAAGAAGPFMLEKIPAGIRRTPVRVPVKKAVEEYPLAIDVKNGMFAPLQGITIECGSKTGVTDSNGHKTFRLAAGTHRLRVYGSGYRPYEKDISVGAGTKPVTVLLYEK